MYYFGTAVFEACFETCPGFEVYFKLLFLAPYNPNVRLRTVRRDDQLLETAVIVGRLRSPVRRLNVVQLQ